MGPLCRMALTKVANCTRAESVDCWVLLRFNHRGTFTWFRMDKFVGKTQKKTGRLTKRRWGGLSSRVNQAFKMVGDVFKSFWPLLASNLVWGPSSHDQQRHCE